jgi:hypothetical protein
MSVEKKVSGDINVSMRDHNQIGHVGHVVNEAPEPELRWSAPTSTANSDGSFTISSFLEIVSPYPPAQLFLKVISMGITELEVIPQRVGMSIKGHSGRRDGWCFTTLMQPSGRYLVSVRSRENGLRVEYQFD